MVGLYMNYKINQWRGRVSICELTCQPQLSAQRPESGCREAAAKNDLRRFAYNQAEKQLQQGGAGRQGTRGAPHSLPPPTYWTFNRALTLLAAAL